MKIKTGDKVKILKGKDAGKIGKVVQVLAREYVVVEGANILKKHMRARRQGEKGQVIELPAPIRIDNVMLIDTKSGKPTRVGFKKEGDTKKRIAKISGEFIE